MDESKLLRKFNSISKKCNVHDDNSYDVLVIDPPWNQGKTSKRGVRPNQTTKLDYATLLFEEIKLLPVEKWSKDQSFIFLWVTNSKDKKTKMPIIKMGFELLEHWGFTYYTTITWDKKTGPCPFSPFQVSTEHILFGYKGKVNFNKASLGKMKTCFTESSSAHSVKPNSFYQNIDQHFLGKKLDVFARQNREGFDGWGDEYKKLKTITKKPKKLAPKRQNKQGELKL